MAYRVIIPTETAGRIEAYRAALEAGASAPGARLAAALNAAPDAPFADALLNTKAACIFAESEVYGDGSDWTLTELQLLGDISIAVDVRIYDDGQHAEPWVYDEPFDGTLVFVPGALLRNDAGNEPADWAESTRDNTFHAPGYQALYSRRLEPVFRYIEQRCAAADVQAMVTIPGLGCGQFAGPFQGQLGAQLDTALSLILEKLGPELRHVCRVHYDPYSQGEVSSRTFGQLSFATRPLRTGVDARPQLRPPNEFLSSEDGRTARLFSLVAWDHVSWPGNDFYGGARSTDDGVKAAATSSMLTPLTPVAVNIHESLVDVSESTVIRLNDPFTASSSRP